MKIFSLGEKIRNRRKELNMTLKDLAGDRVTAGQLSFVELGKSNPSPELLEYIASRLNVSVDYLLESEASQARRICEYNIKLAQAYIYDRNYEDAKCLLDECDKTAVHYDLRDMLGRIELNRGSIALNKNEYEEAAGHFLHSNRYFIEYNDVSGVIESYIMLGETACKAGVYDLSLSYYKQAETLNNDSGQYDEQRRTKICFCICLCYIKLGRMDEAGHYLNQVEEYLRAINDKQQYAHNLMAVSLEYKSANDYERALHYADMAVNLFKEIQDQECKTIMEMNMGVMYSDKGDVDKSDFYLKNCEKLLRNWDSRNLACIYLNLARNEIKRKRYDSALKLIEKGLNFAEDAEDMDCQIKYYSCLYEIYLNKKEPDKCEQALKSKMSLVERYGSAKDLIGCYIEMGEYCRSIGNNDRSAEYMEKGYKLLSLVKEKIELTL